jgi:DNA replication protein DnaC
VRLQNKLYESLRQQYGHNNVKYENNFVDISVIERGITTFYEIKIENNVKKCLRNSIGQLLEYAHYPNVSKADKFIIVGDAPPIKDDANYLKTIRHKYKLPISYGLFNWDSGNLDQII